MTAVPLFWNTNRAAGRDVTRKWGGAWDWGGVMSNCTMGPFGGAIYDPSFLSNLVIANKRSNSVQFGTISTQSPAQTQTVVNPISNNYGFY